MPIAYADGFQWNAKQDHLLDEIGRLRPRHIGLYGGSRAGKTFAACGIIKIRALMAPESNHLVGRLAFNHVKRSIGLGTMPDMDKLIEPSIVGKWYAQDAFFEYPNGSRIWLGGYDDKERIDKVLGNEYSTIFNNEASQIAFGTIETLRGRLAETAVKANGGYLSQVEINDLNPTHNKHWSYREFIEGVHPETLEPIDKGLYLTLQMNPSDNVQNLSEDYIKSLKAMSPAKRRRFFDGDYQTDIEDALWQREWINAYRVTDCSDLDMIVVGVDPSGGGNDDQGIICVGRAKHKDGNYHYYVLEDATTGGVPGVRFEAVVDCYDSNEADRVIGESNFGGDIVEKTVRDTAELMALKGRRKDVDGNVITSREISYKGVTASRGKVLRADPVANLYYQGRVHHVGAFGDLEDEMCRFTTAWDRRKDGSPNRVDALVFAITDLMDGKAQFDGIMGAIC